MLLKWKEPAPLGAPNNIVTTNIRFERENQATAFRRWYMTFPLEDIGGDPMKLPKITQ